jgi:hypothetical protein
MPEPTEEEIDSEYMDVIHSIQSAIAFGFGGPVEVNDRAMKHTRVGINSAMVNNHAVATLLIEKGVFTLYEYKKQILASAKEELARYQQEADAQYGPGKINFS